jgi:predicted enzyme related to lactoylglutathione lyase
MKNAIDWFQIPVTDFERAVKFYSTILSVEFTRTEAMGSKIAIFPHDREAGAVGGALYCGQGFTPAAGGVNILLNAGDDLHEALSKVVEVGGRVEIPQTPINNGNGLIAFIQDTEGNCMGLHSKM